MAIAFATSAAQATLIQANPFKIDQTGTGLGNVQTLLTLQSPGNSTIETGSIIAAGTGQATTGDTQAINNLQSFSGPASNLRLVFNPSEPQNDADGITLQNMTLLAFDAAGTQRFSSGAFSPITLTATDAGTGNSGFVFRLDNTQAGQLDAAIADFGATRIGLSATAGNAAGGPGGATGGHETFFLTAVPEPSTWALFAAGLVGIAGIARRRTRI